MLPNTFGFMFASVGCSLIAGLLIALLLNRKFPGRWLVQTIILLPLMVAPVIAAIMIRWMFNDQFGIVNVILGRVRHAADRLADAEVDRVPGHPADRRVAVDALVRAAAAGRPAEPAARAVRGGADRRRQRLAHVPLHHAADAAAR